MNQAGMNQAGMSQADINNVMFLGMQYCVRRLGIRMNAAEGRCVGRVAALDSKIQGIMNTLEKHTNYLATDEVNINGLESIATRVEKDGSILKRRCSRLDEIVIKQQGQINALNGGSAAQKKHEKNYNDSARVWNKIAEIKNVALKVLAYIGYVLASIITLGILPAVDFTSKSFTSTMAKDFNDQEVAKKIASLPHNREKREAQKKAQEEAQAAEDAIEMPEWFKTPENYGFTPVVAPAVAQADEDPRQGDYSF